MQLTQMLISSAIRASCTVCDSVFHSTPCLIVAVDFSTAIDSVSFTSGVSIQTCQIPLVDDLIIENDETFQLSLSLANAAQGSLSTAAANPRVVTVTINDDGKWSNSGGWFLHAEPLLSSCIIQASKLCLTKFFIFIIFGSMLPWYFVYSFTI